MGGRTHEFNTTYLEFFFFYEGLESVFNGSLELGARVSSILRKVLD